MASGAKSDKEQDSSRKESNDLKPDPTSTTNNEPETGATKDAVMEDDLETGTLSFTAMNGGFKSYPA